MALYDKSAPPSLSHICLWIMGVTGKVLNTIGFCESFEFLGAVLWSIVGKKLGWNAMFCKDALKVSHYCL